MHETSGVLRPAVEISLDGGSMTPEHIGAMRAYIRQWIMALAWDSNPHVGPEERASLQDLRTRVDTLVSRDAITAWINDAIVLGLDPL